MKLLQKIIVVSRKIREDEYLNWKYYNPLTKTFLFLVELSLFSTRPFSKLHFFFFNLTY